MRAHAGTAALFLSVLLGVVGTAAGFAQGATELLRVSGVQGGLAVHVGCSDAALGLELHGTGRFLVHGLAPNDRAARRVRSAIRNAGHYGPVSAETWVGGDLPYPAGLVNLLICEAAAAVPLAEAQRVLAPGGVIATRRGGTWTTEVKPPPNGLDEWTHYLHGPDGNPVAKDTVVGPPKRLHWVGSPAWARHHDHMASLTSMVSAGGRLYYIIDEGSKASIQLPADWFLVARDAFSGVVLWRVPINHWTTHQYPLKSGPAHLLRRLVAAGDRVYTTLGLDAPVSVLDGATGRILKTFAGTESTRELLLTDDRLYVVADSTASRFPEWRREATYVWDNTRRANREWGWNGTVRNVLALDPVTGTILWSHDAPVAPCSLASDGRTIVFHNGERLVALRPADGTVAWQTDEVSTPLPVQTNTGPRVVIHGDIVLAACNNGKIMGFSAADGSKAWEQKHKPSGHLSLKDLLVVDGLVWTAAIAGNTQDGVFTGYDVRTGEKKREFPPDVKVHWFHHRCYPAKATERFLITARNGTEYIDLGKEHWNINHWVRGGCIYGVMPANGLTYAPMHACGCQLEAKLTGLNAMAADPHPPAAAGAVNSAARLQKGPAYGAAGGPAAGPEDWPTFRGNPARGAAVATQLSPTLTQNWSATIGGRLSALTVAAGKVFVAAIDAHTVHALDTRTGAPLWRFTAGGRVDSPPTYYRGLVLFGSRDGCVYALRAADGVLAWRFRGAPLDRRIVAWEQVESAWPVHGAVLVRDGVLHATAGRSMFLDGGIRYIRLDPVTGALLGETVMDEKEPGTGEDMHKHVKGMNMAVGLNDVLSCDGRHIYMRSQKFDLEGNRLEIEPLDVNNQDPGGAHLFCQVGLLDDSWFFRSYWTYGRRVTGGYGGWFRAGRLVPSGRILAFDESQVYGFGRKPEYMVNASVLEYQLFAAEKTVAPEAIDHVKKAGRRMQQRLDKRNGNSSDWRLRRAFPTEDLSAVRFTWAVDQPTLLARGLAVAGGVLFAAGPPDLVLERQAFHNPDDPAIAALLERQDAAFAGREGGELWALATADGRVLARRRLDTIPVFDGLACAGEQLFIASVDGRVVALSGTGDRPLPAVTSRPVRRTWDQPEDPNYLKPAPVDRSADFTRTTRCSITEARELPYRMQASGRDMTCSAVRKLDTPVAGPCVVTTRFRVPGTDGFLVNGFLAFGPGPDDAQLVKCGIRFQPQTASVIEGPLKSAIGSRGTDISAKVGQTVELVAHVDPGAGTVRLETLGETVEYTLKQPFPSISHIGFVVDSAVAEFAMPTITPADQ